MTIEWLEPWAPIERPEDRQAMQAELHFELCASHPLFGLSVIALARRNDRDDVLFELSDGRVAEVHPISTGMPERRSALAGNHYFCVLHHWVEEHMKPLHEEAGP